MITTANLMREEGVKPEAAQAIVDFAARKGRYKFDAEKHVHLLDDKALYGTSTICGESLPKPGLPWWAAEEAALVCFEADVGAFSPNHTIRAELAEVKKLSGYPKQKAMKALQDKYPLFKKARFAHRQAMEGAAKPGTDMHAQLESYVRSCIEDQGGEPIGVFGFEDSHPAVAAFVKWSFEHVERFIWSEAHCYSERLWTGGICDTGAIVKNEGLSVIDFKSSREVFTGHLIQTGGYAAAIKENGIFDANGETVGAGVKDLPIKALIVFAFGGGCEPETRCNVQDFVEGFEHAVGLHKLLSKEAKQ